MTKEMTKQLKRMVVPDRHHCDCCGFAHNCQIHGCAVLRQAVKEVETLAQITTAENTGKSQTARENVKVEVS